MPQIEISPMVFVTVDDADFPILNEFRWSYRPEKNGTKGYAVRHVKINGKDHLSYMHRELTNPKPGHQVLFVNGNGLDCRRDNLAVLPTSEARRIHILRRREKENAAEDFAPAI